MWNEPTKERLAKLPKLYETENIPAKDKTVCLHFFIGGCDWYPVEFDGKDTFFGFAILNQDYENGEWGYVSYEELKSIKVGFMEIDCELEEYWTPQPAGEIEKIKQCRNRGW